MAMTASAIWQPQEDGLREICGLLRQHISPTSNKPQIWQQLQYSQFPDFDNYLIFILARAKDLMMFDENEKLLLRNPPNIHHVNNTSMELRCGVNGIESDIVQACQRAAEDQANYFGNLQKGVLPETLDRLPTGMQATILLELMTIRAFHSQILRRYSLGTTIGFRIRRGNLMDILAILVFVARKVHWQWLSHIQCLPSALEGPGGVWCDVDVVEFSYFGAPAATPKEQLYTELVDGLRGSDLCIGSGSQILTKRHGIYWRRREILEV